MLLPRPHSLTPLDGTFLLGPDTVLSAGPGTVDTAEWLRSVLRPSTGLPLPPRAPAGDEPAITLALDPALAAEAYRLDVRTEGVTLVGGAASGVFYACQALLQLLPPAVHRRARVDAVTSLPVPAVSVRDAPRFGWRGLMLDVARHFMPKHDLLRLVDLLALHRLNTLHLHLTDDQGWRLEIRRHPRLTEVGAWRAESQRGAAVDAPGDGRPHGGFYTQDDIREIVAYAAERHITVVPEIDVPGHSQAAIAAYPELGVTGAPTATSTRWGVNPRVLNTEDSTVAFYRDVLDEVMELFPGPYIGLGGDECPTTQWREDPRTQELMRQRGLADETALRTWFTGRLAAHVTGAGRRVFGWDEILEGPVPEGTVVASWRGLTGARTAARRGLDVVSCPDDQVYLDYRQSEHPDEPIPFAVPLTLADTYRFDPVPDGLTPVEAARVLGGQANVWTEHMDSPRTVDYYVFPRLCAIAEALWSGAERDFADFRRRLAEHLPRLDALGVEYRRDTGPLPWQTRPGIAGRPADRQEWAALIDSLVAPIRD
ncbi:beta-N-acetylhexosaminidase [Streptomyces sp. NPDC094032]|uniref:beta-N-acetylhexosaminidase n=1 Tax=Streptomyces sp. NPDC094032 TaxID=3155308 RepID=UPI00332579EF